MYGTLDISTGGMIAQRTRMAVIASNIAHAHTVLDENGNVNPWRRRIVQFAPGDPSAGSSEARSLGVHVADITLDDAPFKLREDPGHPHAYKDGPFAGYVPEPNIDPVTEQVNAMEAARAYEANLAAAEATKQMMASALRLLA
ncbi:MAG: flagellar basal body rod protein FlgC [Phycisphaerales bacterium]|nr:flagellar basal body rod protein FlgC [Phycisphaerales bacterium]